jgi:outer membrane protein
MKKMALVLAMTAAGFIANNAMAQESPWLLRVRAVNIDPANNSDQIGGVGPSDRLSVQNKTFPEFDVSYFFTKNIAAELILTYPQKLDVGLDNANIGSFKALPPILTAQYHFLPDGQCSPYVGVGINYTNISSVNLLNGAGSLDHDTWGLAGQVGIDYKIDKHLSLNLDVKYARIRSNVFADGGLISNVQVDPVLVGLGVGYRF